MENATVMVAFMGYRLVWLEFVSTSLFQCSELGGLIWQNFAVGSRNGI
jgi:hypothetical protein